jgi:hypothetical protein
MTYISVLQRIQNALPGVFQQNAISDALLGAAADEFRTLTRRLRPGTSGQMTFALSE